MNNQEFEYTKDHLTMEYLESLRKVSDTNADQVLLILQEWAKTNLTEDIPDILELMLVYMNKAIHHSHYNTVKNFVSQIGTVPEYVDWDQIERAQHFFLKVFSCIQTDAL